MIFPQDRLLKVDLTLPCLQRAYVHFLVFQDLQDEVQRENTNLQKLQAQKQQVQELLDGLDEQKAQLEEQLKEVRKKCAEEAQLVKIGWLLLRIYALAAFPDLKWKPSPFLVVRWQSNQHSGHMKEMKHGSSRNYRPSLGKIG